MANRSLFGIITTALLLAAAPQAQAQCNELFLSEYCEGSGNNKALEIYNPGNADVDLSKYRLTRWQNGLSTWQSNYSDTLKGTLGANNVIVTVIDRRNPAGTGLDTPVAAKLQGKANLFLSADYNKNFSMSFNGDDAMSLDKLVGGAWVPVDIFGKIGERPVNAWTDSFPYNLGVGLWLSANKTLIRKATVKKGVTTNPSRFNAKAEWLVYPSNLWDSLGFHRCDCNQFPASTPAITAPEWTLFPNPAQGNQVSIFTPGAADIILFDASGRKQETSIVKEGNNGYYMVHFSGLKAGMYVVQMRLANGYSDYKTLIIP
jgi:hypothetical protein